MSDRHPPHNGHRLSETDELVLLLVGTLVAGGLAASAGLWWHRCVKWLLAHAVLIPAASHPALTLPGAGGAGLDPDRLTVLAAVLLAAVTVAISVIRHRSNREER